MCGYSLRLRHTQKNEPSQSHTGPKKPPNFKLKMENVMLDNFPSFFLGHHLYCCLWDLCRRAKLRQGPGFPALFCDSPHLPFKEEECPGHFMSRGVQCVCGSWPVSWSLSSLRHWASKCMHISPCHLHHSCSAHKSEHSIFLWAARMYYSFIIDEWPPGREEIKLQTLHNHNFGPLTLLILFFVPSLELLACAQLFSSRVLFMSF